MNFEIIVNGVVENTICASLEYMQEHYPEGNYREVVYEHKAPVESGA